MNRSISNLNGAVPLEKLINSYHKATRLFQKALAFYFPSVFEDPDEKNKPVELFNAEIRLYSINNNNMINKYNSNPK